MTRQDEVVVRGARSVEANLWGAALVFSCLCLVTRLGAVSNLTDRFQHITVIFYLLGWVGPAAALLMCAVRARKPWAGAVVPVVVHVVSGLMYWLVFGWA
ncbi:hypothetical protein AB0901_04050 [Streptomyces roseifaciens]